MPVGYHHYYYKDFAEHLHAVCPEDAARLRVLESEERELRRQASDKRAQRLQLAQEMMQKHYPAIKPLLRPCHQKRFERTGLNRAIEPEFESFI